jgi:hypothetical protein
MAVVDVRSIYVIITSVGSSIIEYSQFYPFLGANLGF